MAEHYEYPLNEDNSEYTPEQKRKFRRQQRNLRAKGDPTAVEKVATEPKAKKEKTARAASSNKGVTVESPVVEEGEEVEEEGTEEEAGADDSEDGLLWPFIKLGLSVDRSLDPGMGFTVKGVKNDPVTRAQQMIDKFFIRWDVYPTHVRKMLGRNILLGPIPQSVEE
jgi:hypothetical protein